MDNDDYPQNDISETYREIERQEEMILAAFAVTIQHGLFGTEHAVSRANEMLALRGVRYRLMPIE